MLCQPRTKIQQGLLCKVRAFANSPGGFFLWKFGIGMEISYGVNINLLVVFLFAEIPNRDRKKGEKT